MKILLLVALMFVPVGCKKETQEPVGTGSVTVHSSTDGEIASMSRQIEKLKETFTPCPDEAHSGVLNKMVDLFPESENTVARCDVRAYRLNCVREWATTIKDPCVRDAYESWIAYYIKWNRERRDELITGVDYGVEQSNSFDREQKIKEARQMAYERAHPVVVPPEACSTRDIRKLQKK